MSYNVLIVDDSKSMRQVIRKVLSASGFQVGSVWEAGNGREALELLEQEWIDLILSDVHMPEMDGRELLVELKKQETLRDLPVVFITTESNEDRMQEIMDLGAEGFIRKPFRPEAIRALLVKIMGETDGDDMAFEDDGCDF
jgi:two-component system chemotaxis response regulator CheY